MHAGFRPRLGVVGSANVDLVVRAPKLPQAGETVIGGSFYSALGGKGANQAVAAARLGAEVIFVGRVGADAFGASLLGGLDGEGIDTRYVIQDKDHSSGVALIAVSEKGENAILVASGANLCLTPQDVAAAAKELRECAAILCQLEIPVPAVEETLGIAREAGARAILNAAPAISMPPSLLRQVDVLTVNENEAEKLTGRPVESLDDARRAGGVLLGTGISMVVITLGRRGALLAEKERVVHVPAYPVEPVDTTGAGDAFCAALAVCLAEGRDALESVDFAAAAGALTTLRPGAQPSLPTREEVEVFSDRWRGGRR